MGPGARPGRKYCWAAVLEVSGTEDSLGFLAPSSGPATASPDLFLVDAFLSHCWCRYLQCLIMQH